MNIISLNSQFFAHFSFFTLFKFLFILFLIIINIFVLIKELEINKFSQYQPKYLAAGFLDSAIIRNLKSTVAIGFGLCGAISSSIIIYSPEFFKNKDQKEGLEAISEILKENNKILTEIKTMNESWTSTITGIFTQIQSFKTDVGAVNANLQGLTAKNQMLTNQMKNSEELAQTRESEIKILEKLWTEYTSLNLNNTEREIATQKFESQLKKLGEISTNTQTTLESVKDHSANLSSEIENFEIKKSFIGSDLLESFESLNGIKQFAVSLLFLNYGVINAVITIIFIVYGDYLINKFQLETKYPKLASIIVLRKKFQRYYLFLSFFLIILVSLVEILCSLFLLTL